MPVWLRGLVFLTLVLAVMAGLHYYAWARLVRDTALPSPWRRIITVALIALCLSMPLAFVIGRLLRVRTGVIAWPAFTWLGFLLYIFVALVATEVLRGVWLRVGEKQPVSTERRVLLGRLWGGLAAVVAGGLGAVSIRNALGQPRLRRIDVPLRRWPKSLDGFSVVQWTDVHVGPTIGEDFINGLVERTNALAPDLIVITGDLVDGSVDELRTAVAPIARLRARHGVFFVTGNHEYYSGADAWLAHLGTLGVRPLRNECVRLGLDGQCLDLAGVDDWSARGSLPGHGHDLKRAVAARADTTAPLILLAHQPKAIVDAAAHGVDLQLSGHTHGGQLWPWNYFVRLQQPYVRGLSLVGDTLLYVSCGTGYWGPPMRLGAPAELTHFTLRSAA